MQYDATTPDDYIQILDRDWRLETLQSLRALIKSKAPDIVEGIQCKMLCYGGVNGMVFHLNAQKNYVSLYVGNSKKVDPEGTLLSGLDLGKGCIRFKKSTNIDDTRIDEFIEKAIGLWKRGADIGC